VLKTILSDGAGSFLMIPYMANLIMVLIDTALYFRNTSLDRRDNVL
jgi:hypothetical protein